MQRIASRIMIVAGGISMMDLQKLVIANENIYPTVRIIIVDFKISYIAR